MNRYDLTKLFKAEATSQGFGAVGISEAVQLDEEAVRLQSWLGNNFHGTMSYMENYQEIRNDPRLLLDGAKSVISFAYNYYNPDFPSEKSGLKISRYAAGRDYHKVLKGKLKRLVRAVETQIGQFGYRFCVDSAPIMERVWAVRSGIGWIGKNGNLIIPGKGSFFFLAELIVDLDLEYDNPATDHCGNCRLCIDACPTEAIVQPHVVDGRRCISYQTIEHKGELDPKRASGNREWIFGCDVCQSVCPFNRFSVLHSEPDFAPNETVGKLGEADWSELTKEEYDKIFFGSAVKRAGYEGLKRNIRFLIG